MEVKVNLFINDMVPLENVDMVRLSAISQNEKYVPLGIRVHLLNINRNTPEQCAKFVQI